MNDRKSGVENKPENKHNKKKLAVLLSVFCCVALVAVMVMAVLTDIDAKKNTRLPVDHTITYYDTPEGAYFTYDDTQLGICPGGSVDAFLTVDGNAAIARAGTALYRIDADGIELVYRAGVERALLSTDNRYIVFTTATTLRIYDSATEAIYDVKHDNTVAIPSIVISPDGQTVGYTVKTDAGKFEMYTCGIDGQGATLRSEDAYVIGVGDNAAFWYYIKQSEGDLYYCNVKKDRLLGQDTANVFEFNRNMNEITFDADGITYYSINGRKARALIGDTSVYATGYNASSTQGGATYVANVRCCDSLFGGVFYNYTDADASDETSRATYNLWYVSPNGTPTALARGAYQFSISADNRYLLCLVDDCLYRMEIDNPNTSKLLNSQVYMYANTRDFSDIYCIGYDSSLYHIEDLGNAVLLMGESTYCTVTGEGNCLVISGYEDNAGDLYCIKGRTEINPVGSGVYFVQTSPGVCSFYADSRIEDDMLVCDLYLSADGMSFFHAYDGIIVRSN